MNPLHAAQIEDEFIAFNDYIDNHVRDTSSVKDKKVETVQDSATYGYTKYSVIGEDNEPFIQRYMINHLNHSWSGGDGKYRYNDPKGPDATKLIVNFFKRFGL
jgi:poly(3-hydroxybutyrate) depolymerase